MFPLGAGLVTQAADWAWSSLHQQIANKSGEEWPRLTNSPVERPHPWVRWVEKELSEPELLLIPHSIQRGTPFGSPEWQSRMARRLSLEFTLRTHGRPRKGEVSPEK